MALFTSAGIAAALGTTAGLFTAVAAAVLNITVGVGVSLLAKSLAGEPKDPTFSINGTLQGGGDISRSFIFGQTATAGSLVFVNTWGQDGDTPNAYLTQVIALSDMPIRGLVEVWVNGERVTLGASSDRGRAVNEYADSLWVKFYDGTQTTADSFLFTSVSNGNRWWNPDRIGRGVAYAIVTARVSKNMFSGVPSFKFVLDGMRLYDPSRDSTVGGVGGHRYADPATWGGDGDFLPAVQIYNLLRGIYYNGQWVYGLQNLSSARVPPAAWITQIEKHRAGIQESTGWVNTYRSGGGSGRGSADICRRGTVNSVPRQDFRSRRCVLPALRGARRSRYRIYRRRHPFYRRAGIHAVPWAGGYHQRGVGELSFAC